MDRYKILGSLGKGSFGAVQLAEEKDTGRKVALKLIDKSTIRDVTEVARVTREFAILTSLSHENVIKLFEVFHDPKYLCITMEYADGGTLSTVLTQHKKKKLPEKEAKKMFHQICAALVYCHGQRVIHRDLKPDNILIAGEGKIKIADFGLANTMKYGTRARTPVGTPLYSAPEILFPLEYQDADCFDGSKSDIWSLGVILFQMVTGNLPFPAKSLKQLRSMIMGNKEKYPPGLTETCKELLRWMLRRDPSKRPTADDILQHPWTASHRGSLPQFLLSNVAASTIDELNRELMQSETSIDSPRETIAVGHSESKHVTFGSQLGTGGGEHKSAFMLNHTLSSAQGEPDELLVPATKDSAQMARHEASLHLGSALASAGKAILASSRSRDSSGRNTGRSSGQSSGRSRSSGRRLSIRTQPSETGSVSSTGPATTTRARLTKTPIEGTSHPSTSTRRPSKEFFTLSPPAAGEVQSPAAPTSTLPAVAAPMATAALSGKPESHTGSKSGPPLIANRRTSSGRGGALGEKGTGGRRRSVSERRVRSKSRRRSVETTKKKTKRKPKPERGDSSLSPKLKPSTPSHAIAPVGRVTPQSHNSAGASSDGEAAPSQPSVVMETFSRVVETGTVRGAPPPPLQLQRSRRRAIVDDAVPDGHGGRQEQGDAHVPGTVGGVSHGHVRTASTLAAAEAVAAVAKEMAARLWDSIEDSFDTLSVPHIDSSDGKTKEKAKNIGSPSTAQSTLQLPQLAPATRSTPSTPSTPSPAASTRGPLTSSTMLPTIGPARSPAAGSRALSLASPSRSPVKRELPSTPNHSGHHGYPGTNSPMTAHGHTSFPPSSPSPAPQTFLSKDKYARRSRHFSKTSNTESLSEPEAGNFGLTVTKPRLHSQEQSPF